MLAERAQASGGVLVARMDSLHDDMELYSEVIQGFANASSLQTTSVMTPPRSCYATCSKRWKRTLATASIPSWMTASFWGTERRASFHSEFSALYLTRL